MIFHRYNWIAKSMLAALLLFVSAPRCLASDLATDANSVEMRLAQDAQYLSSDDLEGRGPGTEGIDVAADYIADQFREMGLNTELFDGTPFQHFSIPGAFDIGDADRNSLKLIPAEGADAQAVSIELETGVDYNPLAIGKNGSFSGEMVFVGYGISAAELEYDDFADIDVEGKVVVMFRREPDQGNPESVFEGLESSDHAFFINKMAAAAEHGAVAVIIVGDHFTQEQDRENARAKWHEAVAALTSARDRFEGIDEPSDEDFAAYRTAVMEQAQILGEAKASFENDFDEIIGVQDAGKPSHGSSIHVFYARRDVIDTVVQQGLNKSLATLEEEINDGLTPQSQVIEGWSAEGQAHVARQDVDVKNVVAVLEGEGPLAHETIVIGAHYDHLGYGGASSLSPWTRDIHNGADDNGSGTTTLLEVARQITSLDAPPARRVVFIAFTAEERGLLGSKHYCRSPRFPLEDTVAMINLDMVGRLNEENKLTVYGTGSAESFDAMVDRLGEEHDFTIAKKPTGFGPSDHASFYAKQIPVLFYFTGLHSDYHRPSDDFEGLNIEGMRRIATLTVETAMTLINNEERPAYLNTRASRRSNEEQEEQEPQAEERRARPYFGCIPDYGQDVVGLAISGVAGGGPAEEGGLQGGDVIIKLGDDPISGIEDFDTTLRKYEGGDEVELVVLREGEEVTLTVTLEDPN